MIRSSSHTMTKKPCLRTPVFFFWNGVGKIALDCLWGKCKLLIGLQKHSVTHTNFGLVIQKRSFYCNPVLKFRTKIGFFRLYWRTAEWFLNTIYTPHTDGCNIVTIPALAYLINYLYSQRSGRGRSESTFFKVGEVFNKICPLHYANFRKKISSETSCGMS